jgi:hypothetical protein
VQQKNRIEREVGGAGKDVKGIGIKIFNNNI